jgi:hypothetical protein
MKVRRAVAELAARACTNPSRSLHASHPASHPVLLAAT